jgi:hypothetical protein
MIASEFKLIPLTILHRHEATVARRLDSLPTLYRKDLLHDPRDRYPFLYFLLFRHWPELLNGETTKLTAEDVFYNGYYWFVRLAKQHQASHGFDAGFEQQADEMWETAECNLDLEVLHEIKEKVAAEIATNEKEITVAFSDFSIAEVKKRFGLALDESGDYFAGAAPVAASALLADTLRDQIPLALAIGTEKARSEMIIAPVLVEIRRRLSNAISLFSGVEWNVDPAQGLRGVCDFLLSLSPEQFDIEAPVIAVVEAKKEDMSLGIGQCLAEMVAARIFNQQRRNPIPTIYGVVTTGNIWKFLRLVETTAFLDVTEYHIKEVERIIGILLSMFKDSGVPSVGR